MNEFGIQGSEEAFHEGVVVSRPGLAGKRTLELAIKSVCSYRVSMLAVGRADYEPPLGLRANPLLVHRVGAM